MVGRTVTGYLRGRWFILSRAWPEIAAALCYLAFVIAYLAGAETNRLIFWATMAVLTGLGTKADR